MDWSPIQTAIEMKEIAEPFILQNQSHIYQRSCFNFFGTGNPYFTTDTIAALRATEVNADALFKATKVDGVYSADPNIDSTATKYDSYLYGRIAKELHVMDSIAISLSKDNDTSIVAFDTMARELSENFEWRGCWYNYWR